MRTILLSLLMFLLFSVASFSLTDPFGNQLSLIVTATPTEVHVGEELTVRVELELRSPSHNKDVVIYDRDVKLKGEKELGNLFQIVSTQELKGFLVIGDYDVLRIERTYRVVALKEGVFPLNFFKVSYKVYDIKTNRTTSFSFPPQSFSTVKVLPIQRPRSNLLPLPQRPPSSVKPKPKATPPPSQPDRRSSHSCPEEISPWICLTLKAAIVAALISLLILLMWWFWKLSSEREKLRTDVANLSLRGAAENSLKAQTLTDMPPKRPAPKVTHLLEALKARGSSDLTQQLEELLRASRYIRREVEELIQMRAREAHEEDEDRYTRMVNMLDTAIRALKGILAYLRGISSDPEALTLRELQLLMHDVQQVDYALQEKILNLIRTASYIKYGPPEERRKLELWVEVAEMLKEIVNSNLIKGLKEGRR